LKTGKAPRMELAPAKRISDFTLEIIRKGWVKSAHDCSEGGLAVALAECCMSNGDALIGARVDLSKFGGRVDALLFGESQSRIVLTCASQHAEEILRSDVPIERLGTTGGDALQIETSRGQLSWDATRLRDIWWNSLGRLMDA